jgi:hypothetical protein
VASLLSIQSKTRPCFEEGVPSDIPGPEQQESAMSPMVDEVVSVTSSFVRPDQPGCHHRLVGGRVSAKLSGVLCSVGPTKGPVRGR